MRSYIKKFTFTIATLIALQTPAIAESSFCTNVAADFDVPTELAKHPGKVTLRDNGAAFWLTTDLILMSVEAGFYDTKANVVTF